jgi:hypothetical protein
LVLLSGLDVSAKYNIIAIEKALAALEIRLETGVLGYRAEFVSMFCKQSIAGRSGTCD